MSDDQRLIDLLHRFPVVITFGVAWGEMDAYGHVNNTVYFRYFENARQAYFEQVGWIELMQSVGVGPILGETRCRFRAPLVYPDTIGVGATTVEIGSDRCTMRYAVASQQLQRIVAEGEALVVSYDYRANRKAPLPDTIRQRIEALERGGTHAI